jgi:hypothetical protein
MHLIPRVEVTCEFVSIFPKMSQKMVNSPLTTQQRHKLALFPTHLRLENRRLMIVEAARTEINLVGAAEKGIVLMFEYKKDIWGRSTVAEAGLLAEATLAELATGLIAGTQVATQFGWRDVATVAVGDQVLTFDGGMQTVSAVSRKMLATGGEFAPAEAWPLFIPAEALGNRDDMILLPQQSVMIEADAAEEVFGDPFAMIPALALEGFRGIVRVPPADQIELITLAFSQDEIVFANSGALMFCPKSFDIFDFGLSVYSTLTLDAARALVAVMELDGLGDVAMQTPYQCAA